MFFMRHRDCLDDGVKVSPRKSKNDSFNFAIHVLYYFKESFLAE